MVILCHLWILPLNPATPRLRRLALTMHLRLPWWQALPMMHLPWLALATRRHQRILVRHPLLMRLALRILRRERRLRALLLEPLAPIQKLQTLMLLLLPKPPLQLLLPTRV